MCALYRLQCPPGVLTLQFVEFENTFSLSISQGEVWVPDEIVVANTRIF